MQLLVAKKREEPSKLELHCTNSCFWRGCWLSDLKCLGLLCHVRNSQHFQPREGHGNEWRGLTDLAKRDELASGTVLWVVSVKKKKKKWRRTRKSWKPVCQSWLEIQSKCIPPENCVILYRAIYNFVLLKYFGLQYKGTSLFLLSTCQNLNITQVYCGYGPKKPLSYFIREIPRYY